MIVSKCVVCGKTVLLPENPEEEWRDPTSTKYWSFEEDGSKRPYCDAYCGFKDHEERK